MKPQAELHRGANWIAGESRPAQGGGILELERGAPPHGLHSVWPRSELADVEAALAAREAGLEEWSHWGLAERRRCLELVLGELERRAADSPVPGDYLGLEPEEFEPRRTAGLAELSYSFGHTSPAPLKAGTVLVVPHWSELRSGIGKAVLPALEAGRAVLLFADPRLPQVADLWREVFEEVGLPAGILAILHGCERGQIEHALVDPGVVGFQVAGIDARLAEFYRPLRALRRDEEEEASRLDVELRALRKSTRVVRVGQDLEQQARAVVADALGRAATFSGQRADQVGRVLCPEELFSRFSEALLAELDRSTDANTPLPLIDREAVGSMRATWELAIGEGATPIWGEEPTARGRSRVVSPLVFTNVEPAMQLARLTEPQPILCLMRDTGDGTGDELIAELG